LKGDVSHNWSTVSEINNYYFEIERSIDNTEWNAIGKVKGDGTANSINSYSFWDNTRTNLPQHSGLLFYRLMQSDFDGSSVYSKL
jgi:hypothetical protein